MKLLTMKLTKKNLLVLLAIASVLGAFLAGCEQPKVQDDTAQTTTTPEDKTAVSATTATPEAPSASPEAPVAGPEAPKTEAPAPASGKMVKTSSGLQYEDTKVGEGEPAKSGDTVSMHYTGWLYTDGKQGEKFDSSVDRGTPFETQIGVGQVIKGWDEGVPGMRPGGKRTLIIPAELGYGARDMGQIPPNSTLKFEVEYLGKK
jgi:FKBP-type peptidyl-prolyl cis-trans isomerase